MERLTGELPSHERRRDYTGHAAPVCSVYTDADGWRIYAEEQLHAPWTREDAPDPCAQAGRVWRQCSAAAQPAVVCVAETDAERGAAKDADGLLRLPWLVHDAGVWLRALRHNLPIVVDDAQDNGMAGVHDLGDAAPMFALAPAFACWAVKRALQHDVLLARLLSGGDGGNAMSAARCTRLRATLCTPADEAASDAWLRETRRAGSWVPYCQGYFDTDSSHSWAMWVASPIAGALFLVAVRGVPLDTPVPRALGEEDEPVWARVMARPHATQPFSDWLDAHSHVLGAPLVRLFRSERRRVVAAALLPAIAPKPAWAQAGADAHGVRFWSALGRDVVRRILLLL
jgi:hypothetical protein